MHPFINKASEAAREASHIVYQAMDRPDRIFIEEKGQNRLVSNINKAAEQIIIEVLNQAYPDHSIVAKESTKIIQGGGDFTWLIDPLGGTINFLYGVPHFAISIACRSAQHIEHCLILDPVRQEEFSASRGQGALLNRKRIRVTNRRKLSTALVSGGLPFPGQSGELSTLNKVAPQISRLCRGMRRTGCLPLDLAYVAAGRLDAAWESGLKPWDMAAGVLLIQEAGGLSADFDGEEHYLETGNLITGTPKCFRVLLDIIKYARQNTKRSQVKAH